MQMLFAAILVNALHTALENRERAFSTIPTPCPPNCAARPATSILPSIASIAARRSTRTRERVEHLFTLYQRMVDPLQNEWVRQNRRVNRRAARRDADVTRRDVADRDETA